MLQLQDRIARANDASGSNNAPQRSSRKVPSVSIDEGANKYVLISGKKDGKKQYLVVSKRGAKYHKDAAEPLINELEVNGYGEIKVLGGGRIYLNHEEKRVSIYGHSYGFGQADHSISKKVVDTEYIDYNVTWSNGKDAMP